MCMRNRFLNVNQLQILKKSVADACRERDTIQLELANVIQEKEELKKRSEELSYKLLDLERQLDNGKIFFIN